MTFRWKKRYGILVLVILLVAVASYPVGKMVRAAAGEEGPTFAIIMYHQIAAGTSSLGKFTLQDSQLEADMLYLKEHGYETITMSQLIDYAKGVGGLPEKPVMLTFDDGYESFYGYVYPLLQKYNMKAVLSVVGEFVDRYTKNPDHNLRYSCLDWDEVREMQASGLVEIQNHTYDMHSTGKTGRQGCAIKKGESEEDYREAFLADVGGMQEKLQAELGVTANTFTYPFGALCKQSVPLLKELGFSAALTCREEPVTAAPYGDWMYRLGRYNRPSGKTSEAFFEKVLP